MLWNGLSVEVKPAELLKLSRVAGVVNVWPVAIIQAPEPAVAIPIDGSAPELFTATGALFRAQGGSPVGPGPQPGPLGDRTSPVITVDRNGGGEPLP